MADLVKKETGDIGFAFSKAGALGINRNNDKYCPHNLSSTCSSFSLNQKEEICANFKFLCPTTFLTST